MIWNNENILLSYTYTCRPEKCEQKWIRQKHKFIEYNKYNVCSEITSHELILLWVNPATVERHIPIQGVPEKKETQVFGYITQ